MCVHMAILMLGLAELLPLWLAGCCLVHRPEEVPEKVQLDQHGLLLALFSKDLDTQQHLLASWQLFWEAD